MSRYLLATIICFKVIKGLMIGSNKDQFAEIRILKCEKCGNVHHLSKPAIKEPEISVD